ncbi:hypothetical protein ACIBJI_31720 [Nocardia sp. NPDC050408]
MTADRIFGRADPVLDRIRRPQTLPMGLVESGPGLPSSRRQDG